MNTFLASIAWRDISEVLFEELWCLFKAATKACVLVTALMVVVAFAVVVLVLTGRWPWFVRRWF